MLEQHRMAGACLAVCALLSACGGSMPRAAFSSAAAGRYLSEGNHICATALARLDRTPRPRTVEQAIVYIPSALSAMRSEASALRSLDPPNNARTGLAQALASAHRLASVLGGLLHRLRHGTVEFDQMIAAQREGMTIRAQLDARFRQAGLARCAV
jgi:hypothetical protein